MKWIKVGCILLCFLNITKAQNLNWESQDFNSTSILKGMVVSPDGSAQIVGYERTFLNSNDEGRSWTDIEILDPVFNLSDISISGQIGYIAVNRVRAIDNPSNDAADVYANGKLLKTTDGGLSWSVLNIKRLGEGDNNSLNPFNPGCLMLDFQSVEALNDTVVLTSVRWVDIRSGEDVKHSAAFISYDGGENWKAITPDHGVDVITSFLCLNDTFFIGGKELLYAGTIGSDELRDLYPLLDEGSDDKMYVFSLRSYNNEIWVSTSSDGVHVSTDMGLSFRSLDGLTGANDFYKYSDSLMMAIGPTSRSKASIDGGKTWLVSSPGEPCWDLSEAFNDTLYALGRGVVFKLALSQFELGNFDWTATQLNSENMLKDIAVINNERALIAGFGEGLLASDDGGAHWSQIALPKLLLDEELAYDIIGISQGKGAAYACSRRLRSAHYDDKLDMYYSGLIWRSTDGWKTWQVIDNTTIGSDAPADPSQNPSVVGCYGLDPYSIECVDASRAYVYVDWFDTLGVEKEVHARVFKTNDGGASWKAITKDLQSLFVAKMKFMGDTGYIAGRKILLKTMDGGDSFIDLYPIISVGTDGDLYIQGIDMVSADEVYFQTSVDGAFVTRDGGESFTKLAVISGGNDIKVLNERTYLSVGNSSKTKVSKDAGLLWEAASTGASVYSIGEILNDSLIVLGRGAIYKVALNELGINNSVSPVLRESKAFVKLRTSYAGIDVVSEGGAIEDLQIISMCGKRIFAATPNATSYHVDRQYFHAGSYIMLTTVRGVPVVNKFILK